MSEPQGMKTPLLNKEANENMQDCMEIIFGNEKNFKIFFQKNIG